MTSAAAAAVASDLATAAATIAATFGARGGGGGSGGGISAAAQFLPDPVRNAVSGHRDGPHSGEHRSTAAVTSLPPPQLHVPELSTSQGPAEEQRHLQQLPHHQGGPFRPSASAMPAQLHQQLQPQAQGPAATVPDWARGLPPDVQAELLRAIATAHLSSAQEQHEQSAG